jgi:propanediol dehydratase small subunit
VLKNQTVVDEIEKSFKAFKPVVYDVLKTLDAIDAFGTVAVKNALTTKSKVDAELGDLQATLKNIEEARSFDDLTLVCILHLDFLCFVPLFFADCLDFFSL